MAENNLNEKNLEEQKIELEIAKLALENNHLKKRWYQKISVYATLLPTIVTIVILFIGFKQDYINLKLESLKEKESTFVENETKLKVKEHSINQKQKRLLNSEKEIARYRDSLDAINSDLDKTAKLLDSRKNDLIKLDTELDKKRFNLNNRYLILEEEENVANVRFNINQIISRDGYLTYDQEENLQSFIKSKNKKISNLAYKVINKTIESETLTPVVKGTLMKVLRDATYDKKWHSEIVALYKMEYRNLPHRFFGLFERVNVTNGKTKYIDKSVNNEIVKLLFESLEYPDFKVWNQQDVFRIISGIIDRGMYNKNTFTDNFSNEFLLKLEKSTCSFLVDIILNPKSHRDLTRNVFYGKSGFPYSANNCTEILYTLNSQYLSATLDFIKTNSTFRNDEKLMFDKDIKYINTNLEENSKLCPISELPSSILSNDIKWSNWKEKNTCIIKLFEKFTTLK